MTKEVNSSGKNRVVITGLGVLSPNAHGLTEYEQALRSGTSGIRFFETLAELKFGCQIGGAPQGVEELKHQYLPEEDLLAMNQAMTYAAIAGMDCWRDAGLREISPESDVDWDTGAIIGAGIGGLDTVGEKLIPKVDAKRVRRLGSTLVEQVMASAVSAKLGGILGLGGQVYSNSSACTTGTEAIINAYFHIKEGRAKRVMAGGAEGSSHYIWAGFDGMRVLNTKSNDAPELGSRPMSASANGFIPGSGAGLLMLESLESALERGVRIYAEIGGANVNCGGHRGGGSMTAPNPEGVIRCIHAALKEGNIQAQDIDAINGHLTATFADPKEIENWGNALGRKNDDFPLVNSTKSLIGHGLGAAGGLECTAAILQLYKGFIHGSLNCEDLHPEIESIKNSVVHKTQDFDGQYIAKSSFGFGDVNGCIIFRKWQN
ncbi:MAG: beta-ketoacyl-[acyl-carrier-protein] synthase family protein [Pseudomonadales bacterium]|nr:beta-ketoacyl-[acyl-carrier-protein] synthase family protein [Pseudomonadales bacterium]